VIVSVSSVLPHCNTGRQGKGNGHGKEVIRYFSEEAQADQAKSENATEETLKLAGAWSDLSWEDMEQTLDHIRHDSTPTPPIDEL
jgi:hypothetical protein